jgi:hypothetical protein
LNRDVATITDIGEIRKQFNMAKYNYYGAKETAEREKAADEYRKMERLVAKAMDKWEISDIIDSIEEQIDNSTQSCKDELLEKMTEILNSSGYSVIKTDNLHDEYILKDLLSKNMFDYTEMNKNCLFPS